MVSAAQADFALNEDMFTDILSERLGRSVTVASLSLAGEGMSDDTVLINLADGEQIVLRRHRIDGIARDLTDPRLHFRVLEALKGAGVPAPEPLFFEPDTSVLGAPFFAMTRLPGRAVVPWSSEGRSFLKDVGQGPAGDDLFEILAKIHAVPWRERGMENILPPPPAAGRDLAAAKLATVAELVRRDQHEPEPVLEDALGWLDTHTPECNEFTLVHGDYRAGNLLFDNGRISGILDWEYAHVGDPATDIAWLLAPTNRVTPYLACEMVPADEVVSRYEAASGRRIDSHTVAFWELLQVVSNAAAWISTSAAWSAEGAIDVRVARWSYTLPRIRAVILEMLGRLPR